MTSQEQAIKIKEATARKWERRQARWAAWKAQQEEIIEELTLDLTTNEKQS